MRSDRKASGRGADLGDIVDDLNRLMAEETEASLRYFQMRFRLSDKDYAAAEKFFSDAVRETMEHADAIAQQIRSLGHVPTLRVNLTLSGTPMRLEAAVAEALDVEQQALDAYKDFLPRVVNHPVLQAFIRKQVEIETQHVEEIREFVRANAMVKLVPKPKTRSR